jgi:hypothetical protein
MTPPVTDAADSPAGVLGKNSGSPSKEPLVPLTTGRPPRNEVAVQAVDVPDDREVGQLRVGLRDDWPRTAPFGKSAFGC